MLKSFKFTLFLGIIALASFLVSARDCPNLKLELQDNGNSAQLQDAQAHRSYIVYFKPDTDLDVVLDAEADVECSGGIITHRYRVGVIGFAAKVPADVITTFSTSPHVQVVEEDQEMNTFEGGEMGFGI
ncbi:hypothetical protein K7432_005947 [Basidiobolus ranarum]|uniref:Inhibitor I9 domain-containing protein n=1 Tax=Basidiobolus ranarum TaxID=34480 RepID=A0ABR2W2C4_9FUNG